MQPIVGIPPCLDARGRWRAARDYHYIDAAYVAALEAAGAGVVYLPPQRDAEALLARVDALLLPGGDDLLPPEGVPIPPALDPTPAAQLAHDRRLLHAALERAMPVLGICYGMQLLALEHGGRLDYHLPSDRPAASEHRLPPEERHTIRIEPDSKLAGWLGVDSLAVNSWHHQAVSHAGEGLRVSASAGDGVPEAVESDSEPFCLGVQWHPEKLGDASARKLFRAFVNAC